MSRIKSLTSSLLLGFEVSEAVLAKIARNNDGYPPYNIERVRRTGADGQERLRITLAVAGFEESELEVMLEASTLLVRGRQSERPDADYLFRGIAARQFQRSFMLADGMDVLKASLHNGLLKIDLIRPNPQQEVRKINISIPQ
ncbi:Hsp20 family protein [Agrobacterium sp. ES01]|uniref:Hsp20 family protein n=1 Tax=Agrobacterium sp. ES01 TaxID=3420714 RepID=UPI003D0E1B3A